MFDDTAAAQTTSDPGVTAEPAPGGVLGPDPTATTPATDPAAASAPAAAPVTEPVTEPAVNTTPVAEPATMPEAPTANPTAAPEPAAAPVSEDLVNLKQQALQSLSPLLSHLDQSPEEKFKTTMMMIQASDDQSLVKTAYDAAQAIVDPKEKAQALLDIVNEINYFTQLAKN